VEGNSLRQRCTRFLHACSALCKCANWLCRTCTPHHTVAGRSSVSLTQRPFAFPSNCRCGPPLTSHIPGQAVPSRAWQHTSSHTVRCARLVHLWFTVLSQHLPGGTEESHEKPQDNHVPATIQMGHLLTVRQKCYC
jgi:hypothetical protein